jgi:hypothetical protein
MLDNCEPDSPYPRFMPPMAGTAKDMEDLTNYINLHVNPTAPGPQKPLLAQRN